MEDHKNDLNMHGHNKKNTLRKVGFNFTIIPNHIIYSPNLSMVAKAVYAHLAGRPDGWIFYIKEMRKHFKEGEHSIRKGFKELEETGFLKKEQLKINGKYSGLMFTLYANEPQDPPSREKQNYPQNKHKKESTDFVIHPNGGLSTSITVDTATSHCINTNLKIKTDNSPLNPPKGSLVDSDDEPEKENNKNIKIFKRAYLAGGDNNTNTIKAWFIDGGNGTEADFDEVRKNAKDPNLGWRYDSIENAGINLKEHENFLRLALCAVGSLNYYALGSCLKTKIMEGFNVDNSFAFFSTMIKNRLLGVQ